MNVMNKCTCIHFCISVYFYFKKLQIVFRYIAGEYKALKFRNAFQIVRISYYFNMPASINIFHKKL